MDSMPQAVESAERIKRLKISVVSEFERIGPMFIRLRFSNQGTTKISNLRFRILNSILRFKSEVLSTLSLACGGEISNRVEA
ncbi:MAG TPA: hypothetical protein VK619_19800 [Pyrinomonadaceae bacterium]|nr:hypothetical protein [Pyrinomonadaceae bacterium]